MLSALLLGLSAAAAQPATDMVLPTLFARVRVSADGEIVAADFRNPPAPELETNLRLRMQHWRFEPLNLDGTVVSSETTLTIESHLQQQGRNTTLVIDAVNSGVEAVHRVMPDYTINAAQRGSAGGVLLRCHLRDDGSCGQIALESSSAPDKLVRDARRALKDWRFLPEIIGGRQSRSWLLVPFCFYATPEQHQHCSPQERGSVQTLDSPLRLVQDDVE